MRPPRGRSTPKQWGCVGRNRINGRLFSKQAFVGSPTRRLPRFSDKNLRQNKTLSTLFRNLLRLKTNC